MNHLLGPFYRGPPDDPFVIQLTARDLEWSQFAYQFSHEFCHVLSNYENLKANPNNWFHEAICELASVFTLRRMAERWQTNPPYPNWADYVAALRDYSEKRLSRQRVQLPRGVTLQSWLSSGVVTQKRVPKGEERIWWHTCSYQSSRAPRRVGMPSGSFQLRQAVWQTTSLIGITRWIPKIRILWRVYQMLLTIQFLPNPYRNFAVSFFAPLGLTNPSGFSVMCRGFGNPRRAR